MCQKRCLTKAILEFKRNRRTSDAAGFFEAHQMYSVSSQPRREEGGVIHVAIETTIVKDRLCMCLCACLQMNTSSVVVGNWSFNLKLRMILCWILQNIELQHFSCF